MTQAMCFNCEKKLEMGKPMEELLDIEFPVFCSVECADNFPDGGTKEFKERIKLLEKKIQ